MTSLLAARRKDFAAALGLHARTKSVRFGAAAFPRLKCTLWQYNPLTFWIRPANSPSFILRQLHAACSHSKAGWPWGRVRQAGLSESRQLSEFTSVLVRRAQGQEKRAMKPGARNRN
jgi:hypothetical protein